MRIDNTVGIDILHPRGGNLHLRQADRGSQRDDLTVDVAFADGIVIDQIERTDARSCQRLDRVTADAADAENRDAAVLQFFHRFRAQQKLRSRKLVHILTFMRVLHRLYRSRPDTPRL